MRTLNEIQEGLRQRYSGTLKTLNDRSYIPWNEAAAGALSLFGADGFDVEVKEVKKEEVANEQGAVTYGYSAVVRVTVYTSDGRTFFREGVGYNELSFTKTGIAQIDPAIKGAASGGLLRALVLLGDAFGLFLYAEKGKGQATPRGTDIPTTGSGGRDRPALSDGQTRALRGKGFSPGQVNQIALLDRRDVRALMDDVMQNGVSADEAAGKYSLSDGGGNEWPW